MPSNSPTDLPAPPAAALALSERLQDQLRARITANGPLPFAEFMQAALYTPGLGYYMAGLAKFGPAGDFVTAPELGDLFGRCLARQCAQVLDALPAGGDVLELGAGSGALAGQLLRELNQLGTTPGHYYILELSADLRARQQAHLQQLEPGLAARVTWLDTLPSQFTGVIVANEVLDALPVERYAIEADRIGQLCVAWDGEHWHWVTRAAPAPLASTVAAIQQDLDQALPVGYIGEWSAQLPAWLAALAACLQQGALLLTDYGADRRFIHHPTRRGGTLKCHYRQRMHDDPLVLIGLQDITTDVDFSAVAAAGIAAGLELAGYTTQANFLIANGLTDLLAEPADTRTQFERAQQVKQLTLPDGMGEAFKAIGLTRGLDTALRGFSLRDLRHQL